jgi:hypothetical protein
VVVGNAFLSGWLDTAHQEESLLRMPELIVLVKIIASKPALCR